MTKAEKNQGFEQAEKASNESFRKRSHKQRMDWLEDIWELQKIGKLRARERH